MSEEIIDGQESFISMDPRDARHCLKFSNETKITHSHADTKFKDVFTELRIMIAVKPELKERIEKLLNDYLENRERAKNYLPPRIK